MTLHAHESAQHPIEGSRVPADLQRMSNHTTGNPMAGLKQFLRATLCGRQTMPGDSPGYPTPRRVRVPVRCGEKSSPSETSGSSSIDNHTPGYVGSFLLNL